MAVPCSAASPVAATPADENARMIRTLEKLNDRTLRYSGPESEELSETQAAWVQRVALLHDSRSVHALVQVIQSGSMATDALAELGDAALEPVVRVTRESDPVRVMSALVTLRSMRRAENLVAFRSPESASARIDAVLTRFCSSSSRVLRSAACEGGLL